MRTIEVTVSPEGDVMVEANGFKGKGCTKVTEALEKALGMPGKRGYKSDYNVQETTTQKVG
jgi:hypothetical protein